MYVDDAILIYKEDKEEYEYNIFPKKRQYKLPKIWISHNKSHYRYHKNTPKNHKYRYAK